MHKKTSESVQDDKHSGILGHINQAMIVAHRTNRGRERWTRAYRTHTKVRVLCPFACAQSNLDAFSLSLKNVSAHIHRHIAIEPLLLPESGEDSQSTDNKSI